jgi:hypothetical protein
MFRTVEETLRRCPQGVKNFREHSGFDDRQCVPLNVTSAPHAGVFVSIVVVVEAALVTLETKPTPHDVLGDLRGPPGESLHRRAKAFVNAYANLL